MILVRSKTQKQAHSCFSNAAIGKNQPLEIRSWDCKKYKLGIIVLLSGSIFCSYASNLKASVVSITDCPDNSQSQQSIELETQCPKFYQKLAENGVMATLQAPFPKQLSVTQLQMLQTATNLTDEVEVLDESGLNTLLASIYVEKNEDKTVDWWKQFLSWLNGFKPEKYETEFNWLIKFLEAITPSEQTASIMMYTSFGLIILLTIGLVLWELYLSGVFDRKRRRYKKHRQTTVKPIDSATNQLSFAEIKQLAPAIQSIALLKSVINQLMDKEILPNNSALTNLEFRQCLQSSHSSNYQSFSQLLDIVEPVLYGDEIPSEQEIVQCWQHAEQILEA